MYATGGIWFSIRGYEVTPEPSEPSRTPGCFRRTLGLLLMWFGYSRSTWMAIDKLPIDDLLIDNVPGAPPPEHTLNEESIDPKWPDFTCTRDQTKTQSQWQVLGVENAGGKAYGKPTGLYNKHRNYSEQWDPWHPFRSVNNFQHAQSFTHQTKTSMD